MKRHFQRLVSLFPLQRLAPLGRLIEAAISAGTHDYPREVQRRLRVLNVLTYLIILFTAIYVVQHYFLDYATYKPVIMINLVLIVICLMVPVLHRVHETAGGLVLVAAELVALFAFSAYLGRPAGMQLQYFVFAAGPFVIFGMKRRYLSFIVALMALILHLISWFYYPRFQAIIQADKDTLNTLYFIATVTTMGLISASIYYAYMLTDEAQSRADALLRNTLPASVADRLTDDPDAQIADYFDNASVLFLDLEGFTPLALKLGVAETVEFLNDVVTELDALAAAQGVEKIKTIGDAYLVVGGAPDPDPGHLEKLARFALKCCGTVEKTASKRGEKVRTRIGMAVGPVTAGIIGTKKFSYDVWGHTVNLAARMEAYGEPGRIQVSEQVRDSLKDGFDFEPAGEKDIKGMGLVKTWYLLGEKV